MVHSLPAQFEESTTGDRLHGVVEGRYVTVIRHEGSLFAIDSVCFHGRLECKLAAVRSVLPAAQSCSCSSGRRSLPCGSVGMPSWPGQLCQRQTLLRLVPGRVPNPLVCRMPLLPAPVQPAGPWGLGTLRT